jgi:hypothetical protein
VKLLVGEHALQDVPYAGGDHADLDAFAALDRLAATDVLVIRVAVQGRETPRELVDAADVVTEGPTGLVEPLRALYGRRRLARSRSSSCPPTHRAGGLASTSRERPRERRVRSSTGIVSACSNASAISSTSNGLTGKA